VSRFPHQSGVLRAKISRCHVTHKNRSTFFQPCNYSLATTTSRSQHHNARQENNANRGASSDRPLTSKQSGWKHTSTIQKWSDSRSSIPPLFHSFYTWNRPCLTTIKTVQNFPRQHVYYLKLSLAFSVSHGWQIMVIMMPHSGLISTFYASAVRGFSMCSQRWLEAILQSPAKCDRCSLG